MEILAAIALIRELIAGVSNAIASGSSTVSEADLDKAFGEIDENDAALSAAIARAKARRNPPGN